MSAPSTCTFAGCAPSWAGWPTRCGLSGARATASTSIRRSPSGRPRSTPSDSMSKRLVILRHAKAQQTFTGDDHARTLTDRGKQQSREVGRWLLGSGQWPEAALVSDAMRTRQTFVWIADELGEKAVTPYLDDRLYLASARTMCSVI